MKRIGLTLFGLAAAFVCHTATAAEWQNGSFVFLSDQSCRPTMTPTCYLTNELEAKKTVNALAERGVTRFLLPPTETVAELDIIAKVIKDKGLSFYTYEGWEWWDSNPGNGGYRTCETYTSGRIAPLLALKQKYGDAFAGLQFRDEPPLPDLGRMQALAQCVRANPVLAQMKIFINLLPLYANDAGFAGTADPDAMPPDQYGVDCALGRITDQTKVNAMVSRYSSYVSNIADNVAPDYLAFDLYPFNQQLNDCPAARDLVMSENMAIVSHAARLRGQVPVAYSQNVMVVPPAGPTQHQHANFNQLRWFASWFYVFGGQGTANFLSHDYSNFIGILNGNNLPNQLAAEQSDLNSFATLAHRELSAYPYQGFVSHFLGVNSGALVASVSNDQVLAGEYGNASANQAMLFVAKHNPYANANAMVALQRSWTRIERFDFNSGQWLSVASNSSQISVALSDFPGSLYRLKM